METLNTTLEYLAIFVVGLVARLSVFVAIVVALAAVVLAVLSAFQAMQRAARRFVGQEMLHGLTWQRRPAYTRAHLWLRERGLVLRFGIDALAARLLRQAERVDLPPPGTQLRKGEPVATFTAGSQVVMLPAPVEGTVARVNSRLHGRAALALDDPYSRGWLVEMAPARIGIDAVPREAARDWFDGEAARFTHALEHAIGVAAADGGEPVEGDRPLLSDDEFAILATQFLGAQVTGRPVQH